jgi:hypothetical protein
MALFSAKFTNLLLLCILCKTFPLYVDYITSKPHLKWPAHKKAAEFWTVLRIYCHVPSWASLLLLPAVRSVSPCAPPAVITAGQCATVDTDWHLNVCSNNVCCISQEFTEFLTETEFEVLDKKIIYFYKLVRNKWNIIIYADFSG